MEREGKGGESESSNDENTITDPVELANKLIQMFGGRSNDSSDADDAAPPPPRPPQYVDELGSSAEHGDAPSECWYAVWLLSEGTDKEIPETVTTTGANNSDSYNMAKDYLDKSAAHNYEPAQAIESILNNWTFTNEDTLKSQGDADLYYYLGKAFLTGRNIVLPNLDANNTDPNVVTEYSERERALALQILEYASKLGSPSAKLQLAMMYASGFGAPQDPATAFNYAQEAVTTSPVAADPDDGKAVAAFRDANQKATTSEAEQQLGIFYVTGVGTDPDPDKAKQYINEAQAVENNPPGKSKE
ncbi:MAG: tetratricopeptide repeat protein [Chthoniobacteraceae bacterium]